MARGHATSRGWRRSIEIVEILSPAWDKETDPEIVPRTDPALEVTHERLHERLKPDETAEGRVFALARKQTRPPTPTPSRSSFIRCTGPARRASAYGQAGLDQSSP